MIDIKKIRELQKRIKQVKSISIHDAWQYAYNRYKQDGGLTTNVLNNVGTCRVFDIIEYVNHRHNCVDCNEIGKLFSSNITRRGEFLETITFTLR